MNRLHFYLLLLWAILIPGLSIASANSASGRSQWYVDSTVNSVINNSIVLTDIECFSETESLWVDFLSKEPSTDDKYRIFIDFVVSREIIGGYKSTEGEYKFSLLLVGEWSSIQHEYNHMVSMSPYIVISGSRGINNIPTNPMSWIKLFAMIVFPFLGVMLMFFYMKLFSNFNQS